MTTTKTDASAAGAERQQPQQQQQGPTPERIFQALTAYQATAALKAAIELDVFTAIAEGDRDAAAIARRSGAAERGARILCDFLTVIGFLEKKDGRYSLTAESALFLDRNSPAYLGGMSGFLASDHLIDAFRDFTSSVRKGGTTLREQGSMTPEHPMWVDFARSMAALMKPSAEAIVNITGAAEMSSCKVLDIAAGHGIFGIEVARANPRAQIYAVDWKNVLPVARENAERAGVAERFHEMPGDAFEVDYGDGYDLALVTNFFHHFDPPTCERLMKKLHAALGDDGRVVTLEFVLEEDRISPPSAATFPLVMLGTTQAGDAYTFKEYDRMFRNAGFSRSESHELPFGTVMVTNK